MAAPKKFSPEQMKAAIPVQGAPSRFSASQMQGAVPADVPQDVLTNPKGQGTYQMVSKEGQSVYVPFGKVLDAGKYGFAITPDDFKRFTKDYTASLPMRQRVDMLLQPDNEDTWRGKGLNVFKGTAAGLTAPILHPVQTAIAGGEPLLAGGAAVDVPFGITGPWVPKAERDLNIAAEKQAQQDVAQQSAQMAQHPVYSISSILGPAFITEGAARILPKIPAIRAITELPGGETARKFIREQIEMPQRMERAVDKFGKDTRAVDAANKAADERTLGERGTVDEANQKLAEKHEGKLEAHRKKVQAAQEKHEAEVAKVNEKNAAALKAHQDETKAVQQENREALESHIAKTEKIARQNEGAKAILDAREGLENQIQTDTNELHSRIEKAETDAKAANDAAWDAWRKAVGNPQVQPQTVVDTITAQESQMQPLQVAEFRDILKRTAPTQADLSSYEQTQRQVMTGQGIPADVPYEKLSPDVKSGVDNIMQSLGLGQAVKTPPKEVPLSLIHGWKTQLENDIRNIKDGNVRSAVGNVLDAIRDLETDVSKVHGGANELTAARALHGPYKDTFVNPPGEPATVASSFEKGVNPKAATERAADERAQMLGNYDPEIPEIAGRISDARKRLAKMQTEKAARALVKEFPTPPSPKPVPASPILEPPPAEPEMPEPPEEPEWREYSEPHALQALPDPRETLEGNIRFLDDALRRYGKVGPWVFRLIIGSFVRDILKEMTAPGKASETYAFAGSIGFGQAALFMLTKILRGPGALEWLARPSEEDIALINKLPPRDAMRLRVALKALAEEQVRIDPSKANFRVSPALAAFLGGTSTIRHPGPEKQSLKELQGEMEKRNPKNSRTQSRTPGVTHVYDPDQGKIVSVQ